MKKEVTVGQLISVAAGLIVTLVTAWITLRSDVDVLKHNDKMQDAKIESIHIELKSNYSELRQEIRTLQNTVNDIKVLLERKQDRK